MPDHDDHLTPAQRRTLAALLTARNPAQAAEAANVSERSIRRWLDEPTFAAALRDLERQAIEQATRRLTGGTQTALDTILDIIENAEAASSVRLRAAMAWLDVSLRYRELNELEERLATLEEQMAAMGGQ